MDILHYSGRPIHQSGQMPANGQNFDPSVAALVSSMRQDLVVPDPSIPNQNYSTYSPNSTQRDAYSPISQADFRRGVSPVPDSSYQIANRPYDYRQESSKQQHFNERSSPVIYERGFAISGSRSPSGRSPRDGDQYSALYQQTQHQQQPYQQYYQHQYQQDPSFDKQQSEAGLLNNNNNSPSHVSYESREYPRYKEQPRSMAPQNGYVSPPPAPTAHPHYHPVTTYHEEIQFGSSSSSGVVTPAQLCHMAVTQNGAPSPDGSTPPIQPKPPTSLKPRGSRTRRSLRRAADMLLNRSRQSLSDTEGRVSKNATPTPTPPSGGGRHHPQQPPPTDMTSSEERRAPSIRDRLEKNRARMGELLRSPSLSRWRRGSKENLNTSTEDHALNSSMHSATSPAYVPNRRYRSAENLHTPTYTSYETPDPFLDSRTDGSLMDSSDGMSTRSVESTPGVHLSHQPMRRHSSGHAHPRTRSRDREGYRGYHTADSDTDSSYSRHDGTNGDPQSRYNSKRPLPASLRLLSKGSRDRDGPMRTTPKGPSGPLKADHSIQPFTREKRSPEESSPRDLWAEQGARPKHYSSTDSLETEQVTHIVFQDTPIRSDSDDKNTSSSRPTTPSALRKSSRPASPSRSVRFDDDTDGSYDSDRRDRRPHSHHSRRSESPVNGGRNSKHSESRHQNGAPPGDVAIPIYATVDKSRKSRKSSDHPNGHLSRHDEWTNGVEREDPYSRINDDSSVDMTTTRRTDPQYEEVPFRPRSELIRTRSQDVRQRSGDQGNRAGEGGRRSPAKESRPSRRSSASSDPSYAKVDRQKTSRRSQSPSTPKSMATRGRSASKESLSSFGNPCVTDTDNTIEHLGSVPLEQFAFQSDYDSYKKLSGSQLSIMSRSSISEKVEKTKKKLRRALSLDKLSSANKETYSLDKPKLKKSPSLKSLTGLLKKKDKDSDSAFQHDGVFTKRRSASVQGLESESLPTNGYARPQRTTEDIDVTSPTHGRKIGRLLAIKADGTQVIELVKPPNGPFGFYIAKGTSSSGNGVFVTRLGDGHPAKILAGLLQVGDEILEINDQDVTSKKLDDVYDLMMDNEALLLRVRPLNSRPDYRS